ncbi:MAG: stage III sporulation protein AC [Christensenellaceae bacterium]|jgi:stage III sporulation protein AC|nr:stage III sporulation protein AC [Christensenellaceae bacterium]
MSMDLVFKIAAVGILLAVLNQVLKSAGREDMATLSTLAGLVIVLMMVIDLVAQLFESIKALFGLY